MENLEKFRISLTDLMQEKETSIKDLSSIGVSERTIRSWLNENQDIKMTSLINLADYFNCSIDYLCGRSFTVLGYVPKDCPPFGDWIKKVLKQCGKSSYQLFRETSIKGSQYFYWSKGSIPLLSSLEVIANYLHITLDFLVGRDR